MPLTQDDIFAFLTRKYTQRADARQRGMGLVYMEAETHDLARELERFVAANSLEDELTRLLREAARQIEYLHDKFQETGSGNAVLTQIRHVLEKAEGR
jgi:hypothetical protein